MDAPHRYLDPETLAQVRGLELRARLVVEGYMSGMHKSPYHGFSVEFAQHREYAPGDDLRHVDWKVFGRTERYFLKQYEEETSLACWLLVDVSDSMRYGSGALTKYDYACTAAASLAYLVLHQQDAIGVATFDERVRRFLRPAAQPSYLKEVVAALGDGPGAEKTRLAPILHDLAGRINRRGLLIILSDLFDDVPEILAGLKHLRYQRHEVVLFHIMDAAELDFPFEESTLFRGLEGYPDLRTDPRALRRGYLAEVEAFMDDLRRGCRDQHMDYVPLRTDASLGVVLSTYLARRLSRK